MAIRKVRASDARNIRGATDWNKVKSMTEKEISEAVKLDLDTQEFKQNELMQFKRKNEPKT